MPVIPTYQAKEQLDPDTRGQPRINLATHAQTAAQGLAAAQGAMGGAIRGAAQDVEAISSHLLKRQDEEKKFKAGLEDDARRANQAAFLDEAKQTMPEDGSGFHDTVLPKLDEIAEKHFAAMPPGTSDRYREQWFKGGERIGWANRLANVQREAGATYASKQINQSVETALGEITANPDPANTDAVRSRLAERIATAPYWTAAQRADALERLNRSTLSAEALQRFRANPVEASKEMGVPLGAGYTGTALERTMQILRQKEGFRGTTYYDVNAHRLGYGSDTITDATGTVRSVREGDVVTKEDAERDLARRSRETLASIQRDVGPEAYGKLNSNQQAALGSVAYNYGSLPDRVVKAVRTGDPDTIATAIEGLQNDNGGVNRARRLDEANLARRRDNSEAGKPSERYANLDLKTRQDVVLRAEKEANQIEREQQQQSKVDQFAVQRLIESDISALKATGQGVDTLDVNRVAATLGPAKAAEWQAARNYAASVFRATDGMEQMPVDAIHAKVDQLRPGTADVGPDFADKAALHTEVEKAADKIIATRMADPAEAVDHSAPVREARARLQSENTVQAREALVEARLAAQAALDVPKYAQSPITLGEARQYAAKMRPLARGQAEVADQDKIIQGIVGEIGEKYGRYSHDVLNRVLYQVTLKKEASEVLASAMQRMASEEGGPVVHTDEAQRVQAEITADTMAKATGADIQMPSGLPTDVAPVAARGSRPFTEALNELNKDPDRLLPFFIAKYGLERVPASLRDKAKARPRG